MPGQLDPGGAGLQPVPGGAAAGRRRPATAALHRSFSGIRGSPPGSKPLQVRTGSGGYFG